MVRDRNGRTPTHTRCTTIVTRTDTQTRNVPERIGFVERTRALALAHQMIDHILITSHNSFFFHRNYLSGDLLRLFIRF